MILLVDSKDYTIYYLSFQDRGYVTTVLINDKLYGVGAYSFVEFKQKAIDLAEKIKRSSYDHTIARV